MQYPWIVLDGIEGVGKTTLCDYLADILKAKVISTNSRGEIAKAVRTRFKDPTKPAFDDGVNIFLMGSTILETYNDFIKSQTQDSVVISDRWLASTYASQVHNSFDVMTYQLYDILANHMLDRKPDLYILCTCPLDIINERVIKRGRNDRLDNLDNNHKAKLIDGYEHWYDIYDGEKIKLDCSGNLEEVKKNLASMTLDHLLTRSGY